MHPKTSVRQPVIAGARRHHLSELLRRWRQQPRKRSPLLLWTLLSLALLSDCGLFVLAVRFLSVRESPLPPPAERRILLPYASDVALWEPLRNWVIRVDGRTRLFESFCREAVRRITGEERFEGRDPLAVVVSWMLDDGTNAVQWDNYPCLRCDDAELRALLYRQEHGPSRMAREEQLHGRYVEPVVVRSSLKFQPSSLERQTVELRERLRLFDRIRGGCVDGGGGEEMQAAGAALCDTYQQGNTDLFAAALSDYVAASRRALGIEKDQAECRRLAWEGWLNAYAPVRYALYSSLLAAGLLAIASMARRWRRGFLLAGWLASLGCLFWSATALLGQCIRDCAPIGNGSQAVLWSAAVIMGMGLLLAALLRDGFLARTGALVSSIGFLAANHWPLNFTESWPHLPGGVEGDIYLRMQMLMLLASYSALALSWGAAVLALGRILLTAPGSERLCKLASHCLWPIRIAVVFLYANTFVYGCWLMQQGFSWHGWNVQAVGTLLVLPSCTFLLYARRRGWLPPFRLLAAVVLCIALLAVMGHIALGSPNGNMFVDSVFAADAAVYAAGLISLSLTTHAALRFYFGKQRIFAI